MMFQSPKAGSSTVLEPLSFESETDKKRPFLSVVIPAYNEETRLPATLNALEQVHQAAPIEILVVCDGCTDRTRDVAAERIGRLPLKVITYPVNRGKGYAVREGVRAANGHIIAFMNADGSTPPSELLRLAEPIASGEVDIVIGSRRASGRRVQKQPPLRHFLGKILSLTTQTFLDLPYLDTQCGFKLFRRQQAKMLFNRIFCDGFEFDLEVLYLAKQMNIPTREIGVIWQDVAGSKVAPVRDGLRMLEAIGGIRRMYAGQTNPSRPLPSRRKILDLAD